MSAAGAGTPARLAAVRPVDGAPASASSGRRVAWLLVLLAVAVYNVNLREISSADTIGARLLPAALIQGDGLALDRYYGDQAELPYWVQRVGGHAVSAYPIVSGLLAVPVYLLPVLALGDGSWALLNALAKLSASLIAALSVGVVYLALREVAPPAAAVGLALAYAFGTATWSVSSQGLWGHGPAELGLAVAVYCALRGATDGRLLAYGGLASAVMVASRPVTVLLAVALLAYGLRRDRRHGLRGLVLFAAGSGLTLAYNVGSFGSLQGGYAGLTAERAVGAHYGLGGAWSGSLWQGLPGLLVSPSRGLLVYSPVLLLTAWGLAGRAWRPRAGAAPWLVAGLVASLLAVGRFSIWWGGHSFGPRLLTDFLPALVVLAVPGWQALARPGPRRLVLGGLLTASVAVQLVGVFCYPAPRELDWNTSPRDVDFAHERLWDWRDTQLVRLLRTGPRPVGFGPPG